MSDTMSEAWARLAEALIRTDQRTHAAFVMAVTTALEQELEHCLLAHMRTLPKRFQQRLFRGYGPLSTFSAKIDLAFALGIIDDHVLAELNKIKTIRNRFAHSADLHSLDQPPMLDLFNALARPTGAKGTYLEVFMACIAAIANELEKSITPRDVAGDRRVRPSRAPSSAAR